MLLIWLWCCRLTTICLTFFSLPANLICFMLIKIEFQSVLASCFYKSFKKTLLLSNALAVIRRQRSSCTHFPRAYFYNVCVSCLALLAVSLFAAFGNSLLLLFYLRYMSANCMEEQLPYAASCVCYEKNLLAYRWSQFHAFCTIRLHRSYIL